MDIIVHKMGRASKACIFDHILVSAGLVDRMHEDPKSDQLFLAGPSRAFALKAVNYFVS